jgi:hypothetical protein
VATFRSILFERPPEHPGGEDPPEPACFHDLHLDRVQASLTAGREEYRLAPFFSTPLRDASEVRYRHEVFRDLEREEVRQVVEAFAARMRMVREFLRRSEVLHELRQRQRWLVDAADAYGTAVRALAEDLPRLGVGSRALRSLVGYLEAAVASEAFRKLVLDVQEVQQALSQVRYWVHLKGRRITVGPGEDAPDYSAEIEALFARFGHDETPHHRTQRFDSLEMNHVEAQILDLVERWHPGPFGVLDAFCARHADFVDPVISTFDREVQFYLAYLELVARLRSVGLPFCYPEVSASAREMLAEEAFDLALALKLSAEGGTVVTNDVALHDPERILVVTGPNQGGKTTFARMVGQLHYLASLGVPVPGKRAKLLLPDGVFTHFEREEDPTALRGKLDDELIRVRETLREATPRSVIIMNESFGSSTARDALFLGRRILGRVSRLGSLCVYVTFLDELASFDERTVSMVATVLPEDPTVRTFKVLRRPADGLAYAAALAERYGLGYETLRRRLAG